MDNSTIDTELYDKILSKIWVYEMYYPYLYKTKHCTKEYKEYIS